MFVSYGVETTIACIPQAHTVGALGGNVWQLIL